MSLSHDDAYKIIIIVSVSLNFYRTFQKLLTVKFPKNCGKKYINLRNIEYFRNVKQWNVNEKKSEVAHVKFWKYLKTIWNMSWNVKNVMK